jgi:hypothetical protein
MLPYVTHANKHVKPIQLIDPMQVIDPFYPPKSMDEDFATA